MAADGLTLTFSSGRTLGIFHSMAIPADQVPIGEGVGPDGQRKVTFFVDRPLLDDLLTNGPAWMLDDARFIEEAIGSPDAIFEGFHRENHEHSLCYSVRISKDPDNEEDATPPRFGQVFTVLVERRFGFVVFDWAWRAEDFDHPGHPEQWQTDYVRRTWPTT